MNGEGFQVPPDAEPLEFLMAVMRDNTAAQYRHAKLGVAVTTVLNGQDFASLLEKAIERSQGVYEKVIEHHQTAGENRERRSKRRSKRKAKLKVLQGANPSGLLS
jgi:hypothetical protein